MSSLFISGLISAFSPTNFLAIVVGTGLGTVLAALPGVTGVMGISLLVPFTFGMPLDRAILLLGSIYMGSSYGGSISAILLNIPGDPAAVATSFDGHALAKKGKAGKALGMSVTASFIGGMLSIVALTFIAPQLAKVALAFSPAEYFAIGVFSMSIIATISVKSPVKSLLVASLGLLLGTVGMDPMSGLGRFTFGSRSLFEGIQIVPAIIGLFGVAEVFHKVASRSVQAEVDTKTLTEMPTLREILQSKWTILRSTIIGIVIGILPGIGGTTAAVVSYSEAIRWSKHPEEFGQGTLEGVAAAESANNAAVGGAMVPLMALGIPGSGTTAVMIGAFLVHGVQPGPFLFQEQGQACYTIFASMFIATTLMFFMGLWGARYIARALQIPYKYLGPAILILSVIGSYATRNMIYDVWVMLAFGVLGVVMKKYDLPTGPFIMAMILGPLAEINLRRGLLVTSGNLVPMIKRPLTAVFLIGALISVFLPVIKEVRERYRAAGGRNTTSSPE